MYIGRCKDTELVEDGLKLVLIPECISIHITLKTPPSAADDSPSKCNVIVSMILAHYHNNITVDMKYPISRQPLIEFYYYYF